MNHLGLLYTVGNQTVNLPNWSEISFSSLPAISSGGSFELPSSLLNQLGYDPTRTWSAGQTADQFLMLGDIQDAFHTEAFSLEQIADLSGLALSTLNLNDFNLGGQQTIASLSHAIPSLENLQVSQIAPLASLLSSNLQGNTNLSSIISNLTPLVATTGLSKVTGVIPTDLSSISGLIANGDQLTTLLQTDLGSVDSSSLLNLTIGDLIEQHPYITSLIPLNAIDLSGFSVSSIPGLEEASFVNLANWQQQSIEQIPGLNQVSFSLMPNSLSLGAEIIATADVMWGSSERGDPNARDSFFVSGTGGPRDDTTQIVPCDVGAACGYVELSDAIVSTGGMHGKRWATGDTQTVPGGYGVLGAVNNGEEPTGRLVYGRLFKVVVTKTHESEGTADTGLYFRICHHYPIDLGCTPYFIGAVPWLPVQEKSPIIILGVQKYNYDADPCKTSTATSSGSNGGGSMEGTAGLDETLPGGINARALASATSSIEGDYDSLGQWGCDGDGLCGRGLGRYQFMTYREDVRSAIESQPGGTDFYNRLTSGEQPSQAELDQYFSPEVQDQLFVNSESNLIQQYSSEGLAGDELIACLGEAWYSGTCSHSNARDYTGGPTVYEYGQQLVQNYHQALQNTNGEAANKRFAAQGKASRRSTSTKAISDPIPFMQCSSNSGVGNGANNGGQVLSPGNGQSGASTGNFQSPVSGAPVTSEFGERESPCEGCSDFHKGIDFGVGEGTPVGAADGGTVLYAGWFSGYGNTVIVDHGNGTMSLYAHLSEMDAGVGSQVAQGQTIARSGDTGIGTGAHLHFEVITGATPGDYRSGTSVDPRDYIQF
jgi:murein DD-endopeptidase MepM/ murein hydrolase activator NlpD